MSSMRKLIGFFVSITFVLGMALLVLNRQSIIDEIALWQYQPSSQIAEIANRVKMSDFGKKMFYVSKPQIQSAGEFNTDCRRGEQGNASLGC